MSSIPPTADLKTVGAVLKGLDGRINLRSLAPTFLEQFFPIEVAEVNFRAECLFSYAPTEGALALRVCIAEAASVHPDDVVITDGASQAILLLLLARLKPCATVLVPRPVFPAYLRIAASRGCGIRFYDWRADGAALLEQLRTTGGEIDAVIVNSPHNPTGIPLSAQAWGQISAACAETPSLVILDDTYCWLDQGPMRITHFNNFAGTSLRTCGLAAVGSLGKLLCLPGLRLGFVITRDSALRDAVIEVKRHLAQASCSASEYLACALLDSPEWRAGRESIVAALDKRRLEFGKVALSRVRTISEGFGFYVYADGIADLTKLGLDGINGAVFEGSANAARFCLASSAADWARFNQLGDGN